MKLIGSTASPFVRIIRAILIEGGIDEKVEKKYILVSPLEDLGELYADNPLGKIPILVLGDNSSVYDSRVISRYLDSEFLGDKHYGVTVKDKDYWELLKLESLVHGILESSVSMVYESRFREEGMRSSAWVEGQQRKVERGLVSLAGSLDSYSKKTSIESILVGCALGFIDFRLSERIKWRESHGELGKWYEEFKDKDFMRQTEPK